VLAIKNLNQNLIIKLEVALVERHSLSCYGFISCGDGDLGT